METDLPAVLVADDDADVRRKMRIMLDAAGYRVLLAADVHVALDLLIQHPDVRVAFIDPLMPVLEGLIRSRYQDVRVIALAKPVSLRMVLSCLLAFEPATSPLAS